MKFTVQILCILCYTAFYAQTPKETVQTFFEALNSKNAVQIESLMADDVKLHSLNISVDVQLNATDKDNFIKSIKGIGPEVTIKERIFDVESYENEHIATVWTPYEFYVNDNFSHKGVNVFTMLKVDKKWKITSIADTRLRTQK